MPKLDLEAIRRAAETETAPIVAERFGCSASYVRLVRSGRIISKADREGRGIKTKARFVKSSLRGAKARPMPAFDVPWLAPSSAGTAFPDQVTPIGDERVLKPGKYAAKIGGEILKGRWKGFPVFTLTLEERATCPVSCRHWRSCYGNNMGMAKRYRHGPELEDRLVLEIAALAQDYPQGFAVRLHVLGDFYSVAYVRLWRALLRRVRTMVVFGFTAHIDNARDPIAREIAATRAVMWNRFAIRGSNANSKTRSTISIEHPVQLTESDTIVCPEQLGKTESCSTCALCWQTERRIAFLQH